MILPTSSLGLQALTLGLCPRNKPQEVGASGLQHPPETPTSSLLWARLKAGTTLPRHNVFLAILTPSPLSLPRTELLAWAFQCLVTESVWSCRDATG